MVTLVGMSLLGKILFKYKKGREEKMKPNVRTLNFKGKKLFMDVYQYRNNDRLGIYAYTRKEAYGMVTINLSGLSVNKNEEFIESNTKDSGLEQKLIDEGIIKKVKRTVKYNMGKYDLVVFDMEKLKEFDPSGVKEYQEENIEEFE